MKGRSILNTRRHHIVYIVYIVHTVHCIQYLVQDNTEYIQSKRSAALARATESFRSALTTSASCNRLLPVTAQPVVPGAALTLL
jgi:methionyl-tRNA synthetase